MRPSTFEDVQGIVRTYFEALHYADVTKLASIFSEDCVLKAPGVRRTRDEWLNLVETRPAPAEQTERFGYAIQSIEIIGDQAMVRLYCPLLGKKYIDYLGLLRENNNQWLIVNKMYADLPEVES